MEPPYAERHVRWCERGYKLAPTRFRLKFYERGIYCMNGLEIVMDIETLEIFEVIDHDGKDDEIVEFQSSDFSDKRDLNVVVQLNLFESMFAENST